MASPFEDALRIAKRTSRAKPTSMRRPVSSQKANLPHNRESADYRVGFPRTAPGDDEDDEETPMANGKKPTPAQIKKLRSRQWFDNPDNPDMTALYLERYMNYGLTREELSSGKPIIGIAQSGSDLSPCNRHHLMLAPRVREGIREAGGIAFEFPVHPIQETGKRPTASLDRNLAYLGSSRSSTAIPSTASCSPPAATRPRPRS